jgi:hypothetical protein
MFEAMTANMIGRTTTCRHRLYASFCSLVCFTSCERALSRHLCRSLEHAGDDLAVSRTAGPGHAWRMQFQMQRLAHIAYGAATGSAVCRALFVSAMMRPLHALGAAGADATRLLTNWLGRRGLS